MESSSKHWLGSYLLLGPSQEDRQGGSCPGSCFHPTPCDLTPSYLPKCVHMPAAKLTPRFEGSWHFHPKQGLHLVFPCAPNIPWRHLFEEGVLLSVVPPAPASLGIISNNPIPEP